MFIDTNRMLAGETIFQSDAVNIKQSHRMLKVVAEEEESGMVSRGMGTVPISVTRGCITIRPEINKEVH